MVVDAWRAEIDSWHQTWDGIIATISDWYDIWHSKIEAVVSWQPGAEGRIKALEEQMKYITVHALVEEEEKDLKYEKDYTVIEADYTKYVAQQPGTAAYSAISFKKYLNAILPEEIHVEKVFYWQRGYTGELVTGVPSLEEEEGSGQGRGR